MKKEVQALIACKQKRIQEINKGLKRVGLVEGRLYDTLVAKRSRLLEEIRILHYQSR